MSCTTEFSHSIGIFSHPMELTSRQEYFGNLAITIAPPIHFHDYSRWIANLTLEEMMEYADREEKGLSG